MNKKALSLFLAVASVISVMLPGCASTKPASSANSQLTSITASSEAKPVKLSAFFFAVGKQKEYDATFAEFTKLNPNITVETLINDQDYYTILKTEIASNTEPDIVQGEYGDLYPLGKAGHVVDLSKESFMQNYSASIKDQMTTPEGRVNGIALDVSGMGIYYNKDLFKKAGITEFPTTQTGLKEACEKLKANGITPFAVSVADPWTLAHMLFTAVGSTSDNVKTLVTNMKAGQPLKSDKLVQAFKTIDMMFQYSDKSSASNNYGASLNLLAQGKVAMLHMGFWAYTGILDINKSVNLGYAAIPYSENSEDAKMAVNISGMLCLGSQSKNKDAVLKLFSWLASKEGDKVMCENFKEIPVFDGVTVTSTPIADDIKSYLSSGKIVSWSQVLMDGDTRTACEPLMQSYYFKKKTVDNVLDSLRTSWIK
jgi:raffinose/stachyose/melibiose transport system substrate-binding protein